MPVTAKLSRHFYDKLGDEVANELVDWFNNVDLSYRTELLTLNDRNFARFDAKVEQRFAEQDARWERRFADMDVKWERRFVQMDAKIDGFRSELRGEIRATSAATETRLVRWMFAFWTATMVTQVGLFLAVLRLR